MDALGPWKSAGDVGQVFGILFVVDKISVYLCRNSSQKCIESACGFSPTIKPSLVRSTKLTASFVTGRITAGLFSGIGFLEK